MNTDNRPSCVSEWASGWTSGRVDECCGEKARSVALQKSVWSAEPWPIVTPDAQERADHH